MDIKKSNWLLGVSKKLADYWELGTLTQAL